MKRLLLLGLITAAVLLGAAAALDAREPEAVETMAAALDPTPAGYVLSEYGGRVAVYAAGETAPPREITAIWVRFLPAADRQELRGGISAGNDLALAALLEDLGS